ncbi:MAG: phosphoribosylanthranilate isomerase [Bacteroidota bacterium]
MKSVAEVKMAISLGADALGLVGPMPSGPGMISNTLIAEIVGTVPPPVSTFLLTSETTVEGIIAHHQKVHTHTIQIVDELKKGTYAELREALPGIKLVQVIHVVDERNVDEALRLAEQVDALLLDSGNPKAKVKTLGGTGQVHDWSLSRKIREQSSTPLFLAGGLKESNVRQAIEEVGPYGLDLCSGVRTDGHLDQEKLTRFMQAARQGNT